jgi:hypothetical protein
VIDLPPRTRSVENEDLRALNPFRPGLVLPIAVAGKEPSGMPGENPHFRTAHETAGVVARPRHERDLENVLRGLRDAFGDVRKPDRNEGYSTSQ